MKTAKLFAFVCHSVSNRRRCGEVTTPYGKHMRILSIVFLLAASLAANGQNISQATLLWKSAKAINQANSSAFGHTCQFTTRPNNSVEWNQANGKKTTSFSVSATSGQWADVSKDGQFTYQVQDTSAPSITGTLTFSRSGGKLTVRLQLSVNDKPDQDYLFSIDSVTTTL